MTAASTGPIAFASTKFVAPRIPATYVPRPGLLDRLDAGRDGAVTVVIGLPGSGKTTLVASWLSERSALPSVWLDCDRRDGEPTRFWSGLVHALRRRWPDLYAHALDLLDEPDPDHVEVAIALVNDLAALGSGAVVVIDDCHLAKGAMPQLGELLERLPDGVRFVLTMRSHVDLPMARLRVHGALDEIRQDELGLTEEEVGLVLDRFGVRLASDSVERLTRRTEGWMAAVQLAALSMRGLDDPDAFVREFSASTRVVTDYLIEEVLERQSPELRAFMTEISVLDQFDAPLCRDVTGRPDSDRLLRQMETENLFLIPVGGRQTFRFHELFADLLRLRLEVTDPRRRQELHRAAAVALDARGAVARALHHYVSAGDGEDALGLVRKRVAEAYFVDDGTTINSWLAELGTGWVAQDPARMIHHALLLHLAGRIEEAHEWVERIGHIPPADLSDQLARYEIVAHFVEGVRGNATASLHHAALARQHGDPASEPLLRAVPSVAMQCHLCLDDIPAAHAAFADSQRDPMPNAAFSEVLMPSAYSWVWTVEGGLRQAGRLARGALAVAERLQLKDHPALDPALRTLGWIHYERGETDQAQALLNRALAMVERNRPAYALLSAVALGRVWLSVGEVDSALDMAGRARTFLASSVDSVLLDLVGDLEGRAALTLGSPGEAEMRSRGMRPSRRRAVLEARIALARDAPADAAAILADPRFPPTTTRSRVHDRALRSRCALLLRDQHFPELIGEALEIAGQEGLMAALRDDLAPIADAVRPFLPVRASEFARSLGAALDRALAGSLPPRDGPPTPLPDSLSRQELRVLRYLASRLTQREIAGELFLSTNTVKTHVRAIFRKLDAASRPDAVERARRVGLLYVPRTGPASSSRQPAGIEPARPER